MAKTIKEMIEVMDWFDKGGGVERVVRGYDDWEVVTHPSWDWNRYDYRVKKPKQNVTIEKWLVEDNNIKFIVETSNIDSWLYPFPTAQKLKLIESYEVEI